VSRPTFYFDEPVELAVIEQLTHGGVDAVSAHALGFLGKPDAFHLQTATEMGRVLCTYDTDFLVLAAEVEAHSGIVYAPQTSTSIGQWVRDVRALAETYTAEDFVNMVLYLPLKT
jgi:predicted nuclease of predicted toxin-antitoxin system